MIVTTGHNIEGFEIVEYLNVITAEYAFQTTHYKGTFSKGAFNVMNAAGNYGKSHKGFIGSNIPRIFDGLRHQARSLGADGIISVSIQFSAITDDFVIILGTGTAVKVRRKTSLTAPNGCAKTAAFTDEQQSNTAQLSLGQYSEKPSIEYSEDSIQTLKYIVENIEQFKNTQEIKEYYLRSVKPEDIDASLVQTMEKRIALERMYGSMKYDTKKDIEQML